MQHLPPLIQDLALILISAAGATLLCRWLKQPVVLGYILAGILVGPHTPFFATVTEAESVRTWAEIGVIFLLFGLGLEFSFKKLLKTGFSASVAATIEVLIMMQIGYGLGRLLGWNSMDAVFLGAILSISSTSIVVRALDEAGLKTSHFSRLVYGILIVEDIVAVVLMVVLSTYAAQHTLEGAEVLGVILRIVFFITVWFLVGVFVLPSVLKKIKKHLSDEILLVIAVGLCLGMAVLASQSGLSAALGAFLMGSLLAETVEAERVEKILHPVRALFSAVFFVSVGMMLDLSVLREYAGLIFLISGVFVVSKTFAVSGGAILAGNTVRDSVRSGMTLSQIGEFSFIIATLGMKLKVVDSKLYSLAISISTLTAFTTPHAVRLSQPVSEWVEQWMERTLPTRWWEGLRSYQSATQRISGEGNLGQILKKQAFQALLNVVVVIAVGALAKKYLRPEWIISITGDSIPHWLASAIAVFVMIFVSSPFLWAVSFSGFKNNLVRESFRRPGARVPVILVSVVRVLVGFILLGYLLSRYLPLKVGIFFVLGTISAGFFLLSERLENIYEAFMRRFILNFSEREREEEAKKAQSAPQNAPVLLPWDSHIDVYQVSVDSPFVGQTLGDLGVREKYSVTIAMVERGKKRISAPPRDTVIYPGDRLYVFGEDRNLVIFKSEAEKVLPDSTPELDASGMMRLHPIPLDESAPWVSKSIRECGIRESLQGLVVGVERSGARHLNPSADWVLKPGDLVWVVGNTRLIQSWVKSSVKNQSL